jgi:hypothetical protein
LTDATLVPPDAATGLTVAISVSNSADLARLGLTPKHCDLAVAEIARAVLIAGGSVMYGGRIQPEGFTQILMDEVQRYADGRNTLTICLAETEHRKLSDSELDEIDRRMGTSASLVCLDANGNEIDIRKRPPADQITEPAGALTAMRRYITERSSAHVLVGGQLRGHEGAMPGVVEEAILSVEAHQPVYAAGGFGGASAAVAHVLGRDGLAWAPRGFPAFAADAADALQTLSAAMRAVGALAEDGLSEADRRQLAASHRPGDIAALVAVGLARTRFQPEGKPS